MAVIAVACTYQCAETTRIARGFGTARPKARHASVYRFFSSAFIGFPCPKNAAGMTVIGPSSSTARSSSRRGPPQRRGQPPGTRTVGRRDVAGIGQRTPSQGQAAAADARRQAVPQLRERGDLLVQPVPPPLRQPGPLGRGGRTVRRQGLQRRTDL